MEKFVTFVVAFLLAVAVVVGGASGTTNPDSPQFMKLRPVIIGDDGGGGVDDHVKFLNYLRGSGVPVRIEGMCASACTLVAFGLPRQQVCVTKNAFMGFHLATVDGRPDRELTNLLIARWYPQDVQEWIRNWEKENGPLTVRRIAWMPAHLALRTCSGN